MVTTKTIKNPAEWVGAIIRNFISTSPDNTLKKDENERAWSDPLVGFSRGDDPLYDDFKIMIGDFYWTPFEIFSMTFPEVSVAPHQLTIISWILPQTELTKADNRRETNYPAERWIRSRIFGEEANEKLRAHVAEVFLTAVGAEPGDELLVVHLGDDGGLGGLELLADRGKSTQLDLRLQAFPSGLGILELLEDLDFLLIVGVDRVGQAAEIRAGGVQRHAGGALGGEGARGAVELPAGILRGALQDRLRYGLSGLGGAVEPLDGQPLG